MNRINVTLSSYEDADFPNSDEMFEAFVIAELRRRHPGVTIDVSTAQGGTKVFVDGVPDQQLASEIVSDWWTAFCESDDDESTAIREDAS